MRLRLQFEDAPPAPVLQKNMNQPEQRRENADEDHKWHEISYEQTHSRLLIAWTRQLRPHLSLQRLTRPSTLSPQTGEKIAVRIPSDLRMDLQDLRHGRVGAAHILLIGQQRWVALYNLSQGRTNAQQLEEFVLRISQISFARDRRRTCLDPLGRFGSLRLRNSIARKQRNQHDSGAYSSRVGPAKFMHPDVPLWNRSSRPVLPIQRVKAAFG